MPAVSATAPGKIILFGEHAVVYSQPAIAAPLTEVRSRVAIQPEIKGQPGQVFFHAPDIDVSAEMDSLQEENSFRAGVQMVLDEIGIEKMPPCRFHITSTIPVASGLGSSASVSAALIRATSKFLGHPFENETVNKLTFEMEKLHHGTPSGVDNTVVVYGAPVYFIKGQEIERFRLNSPLTLLVADTGVRSSTATVVGDVRKSWEKNPERFDQIFDEIGQISQTAKNAMEAGRKDELGDLMNKNHGLLIDMGVSCPELNTLVDAALQDGASGAKLSGGGRGGNMISLVTDQSAEQVKGALLNAGAVNVIETTLEPANG